MRQKYTLTRIKLKYSLYQPARYAKGDMGRYFLQMSFFSGHVSFIQWRMKTKIKNLKIATSQTAEAEMDGNISKA